MLIAAFRFLNSPQKYLTIVYTPNKELRKNLTFLLSQPHQNCIFPHFIALFWPQDEIASLVEEWGRRSGYSSGGYAIRLTKRSPPQPSQREGADTHPQPLPKGGGQGTSTYTFRRICYPPEQMFLSPSLGVLDGVASPVEEWGRGWVPVQADMLSACMEYEDILSDKQRGAHPSPFPSKARLPVAFPKGRELTPTPLFLGGCTAAYCGLKILILGSGG